MSQRSDQPDSETGVEADSDGARGTTRRRLLASGAATWATVALAGCPGDGGDATPADTATDSPTATDEPTPTETPEPQPENYVVTTETWTGGGVPAPLSFVSSCARSNTFVPGMQVVFFVGIFDPDTGDRLTSDALSGVQVNLGDGMETVDLSWTDEHGHATRNEGNNWVGSWDIPEDMDPQSLSYTVEVTNEEANFRNVGVLSDAIDIVEYDDPSNLIVDTDTFWNGAPVEAANGFVGGCAPERQFSTDMDVTFAVGIYDSTSGNLVGPDGLYNSVAETVEDEGSEFANGLDSATVVSSDGSFPDVSLSWSADPSADNPNPQWSGTLETGNLSPGTYGYEVQITDESTGRVDTGVASAQFSIIEVSQQS